MLFFYDLKFHFKFFDFLNVYAIHLPTKIINIYAQQNEIHLSRCDSYPYSRPESYYKIVLYASYNNLSSFEGLKGHK